jgi:hypothetical protein
MMVKDSHEKLLKILQMQANSETVFHIFLAKKISLLQKKKEELIPSK